MIKFIPWLILFTFLVSCRDELGALPKPKGLIPEDKMVNVLKDLSLIEAHIQMKHLQVARYKHVMQESGDAVLAKYAISRNHFESSMDYYGSRQEKMQELYARVLDSLNLMSGKIMPSREEEAKKAPGTDTLQKLPGLVRMTLDKKK